MGKKQKDDMLELSLEQAVESRINELVTHFFPQGRETGQGFEIRPGMTIRLQAPIGFFDTQRGGSGDFMAALLHCGQASSREEEVRLVTNFLVCEGVKLKD